jgi:Protein of unknown function (DUF2851)
VIDAIESAKIDGAIAPRSGTQPKAPLIPLRERDLAQLWESGRIPASALVTEEGVALQIVYRGRPNAGAGPDFRDAVIALPDARLLHGDVELHVIASDFRRHGHDRDQAYAHVVLHLVYRADAGRSTALPGGRHAPVVALERWLQSRTAEISAMLEQPALWREPCQTAVDRMGAGEALAALVRLGKRRLQTKAARLQWRDAGAALYESALETLGYGAQRGAWVELGRRIPAATIEEMAPLGPEAAGVSIEALLLGASGLLPERAHGESLDYVATARQRWRQFGAPRAAVPIAAGYGRPGNHPARRLAGLARLLNAGTGSLLARSRLALLTDRSPARSLIELLVVPPAGPWSDRLLPWVAVRAKQPALIGPDKAAELLLNATLPVLLAEAESERRPLLAEAVWRAFEGLAQPNRYGKTAHLLRALRDDRGSLIRTAGHGQGALYLYEHYCTRGGCGRCPLS